MQHVRWMLFALVPFLLLGCGALSFSPFTSSYRHQSKVWQAFPCDADHWQKQYACLFDPCGGHGALQAGLLKSFEFSGVRLPEQRVAEGLDRVRKDMVQFILENEGKLDGEPLFTLVRGCLEGFALCYVQGGRKGHINGTLTPGPEPGTWTVKCELIEDSAND